MALQKGKGENATVAAKPYLSMRRKSRLYERPCVLRDFAADDIAEIANTFHAWQKGENYEDIKGFCYSASIDDIKKHDFVLTPGRYVGAAETEEDSEPFPEKMQRLTATA